MDKNLKLKYLHLYFESLLDEIDPVFTHPDIVADELAAMMPLYREIERLEREIAND